MNGLLMPLLKYDIIFCIKYSCCQVVSITPNLQSLSWWVKLKYSDCYRKLITKLRRKGSKDGNLKTVSITNKHSRETPNVNQCYPSVGKICEIVLCLLVDRYVGQRPDCLYFVQSGVTHTQTNMRTVRCSELSISGAIQPSVPAIPDALEKECLPAANFLHNPKSDIRAFIWPLLSGRDRRTLCGFKSLCTRQVLEISIIRWY